MGTLETEAKFKEEIEEILNVAESWGIDPTHIKHEVSDIFKCSCERNSIDCGYKNNTTGFKVAGLSGFLYLLKTLGHYVWIFCKILFCCVMIYTFISCHNPTQKFVMRHSQSLIYPIMRTVRLWTLPVIKKYDSLTEWHEEECLLKNPFYEEVLLDCWPCEDIRSIVDLTGLVNYTQAYCSNEKPFIVRDVMPEKVTFEDLRKMYADNKQALSRGTAKFISGASEIQSLSDLFNYRTDNFVKDLHVTWKVNRVSAARIFRQVFRRPYFVPNRSEVALQRFIYFDGPEATHYYYPLTDFANVWLAQGQGYRVVVLEPSESCRNNCSTVSVLLKPKDVLYYNWQFWRPKSLPARISEEPSITYMGSFY